MLKQSKQKRAQTRNGPLPLDDNSFPSDQNSSSSSSQLSGFAEITTAAAEGRAVWGKIRALMTAGALNVFGLLLIVFGIMFITDPKKKAAMGKVVRVEPCLKMQKEDLSNPSAKPVVETSFDA